MKLYRKGKRLRKKKPLLESERRNGITEEVVTGEIEASRRIQKDQRIQQRRLLLTPANKTPRSRGEAFVSLLLFLLEVF
jgi:hypothetical protein